jgi:hypothetical protein
VGCHTGLHAGTWDYATTFSGDTLLLVKVNPRDVVSVPTDCNWQKIRTCRYTVVDVVTERVGGSFYGDEVEVDESDDDFDLDGWTHEVDDNGYCVDCDEYVE